MVTAKVAPEHRLALAQAASRHAAAAHAPGHATLWLAVIGLAAACIAVYRVSLWLHPFTRAAAAAAAASPPASFPGHGRSAANATAAGWSPGSAR